MTVPSPYEGCNGSDGLARRGSIGLLAASFARAGAVFEEGPGAEGRCRLDSRVLPFAPAARTCMGEVENEASEKQKRTSDVSLGKVDTGLARWDFC